MKERAACPESRALPHRDGKPLRRLVRANLAGVIGESALAIDHREVRAAENRGQPLQRVIQQGDVGGIVLGVFFVIEKRVAQTFSR